MNNLKQSVSQRNLNGKKQEQDSNGANEAQEERLVVGVDFGTTYSGVAVVYSGQPDDVDIIKTYVAFSTFYAFVTHRKKLKIPNIAGLEAMA
jgi:hypothetical protein